MHEILNLEAEQTFGCFPEYIGTKGWFFQSAAMASRTHCF